MKIIDPNLSTSISLFIGIALVSSCIIAAPVRAVLGARNGIEKDEGESLPYDAEVEYLESTGYQFINTDFVCDKTIEEFNCEFSVVANVASGYYMGSEWNNKYLCVGCRGGTLLAISVFCGKYLTPSYTVEYGKPISIVWTSDSQVLEITKIESGEITSYSSVAPTTDVSAPLRFFGATATQYRSRMRLYFAYVKMPEGAIDLIPVRKGNVGYLYDRANPQSGPLGNGLYPNMGTIAFKLGPDK